MFKKHILCQLKIKISCLLISLKYSKFLRYYTLIQIILDPFSKKNITPNKKRFWELIHVFHRNTSIMGCIS